MNDDSSDADLDGLVRERECAYCPDDAEDECYACRAPLCCSCGGVDDDRRFCPECDNRDPGHARDYGLDDLEEDET